MKENKKNITYILSFLILLNIVLIIVLAYIIIGTDLLQTKIDEKTANYISFNDSKNTDIIKWILLNDGISFLTLVLEYFNNIINNSKAVEYQKEM